MRGKAGQRPRLGADTPGPAQPHLHDHAPTRRPRLPPARPFPPRMTAPACTCIEFRPVDCTYHGIELPAWKRSKTPITVFPILSPPHTILGASHVRRGLCRLLARPPPSADRVSRDHGPSRDAAASLGLTFCSLNARDQVTPDPSVWLSLCFFSKLWPSPACPGHQPSSLESAVSAGIRNGHLQAHSRGEGCGSAPASTEPSSERCPWWEPWLPSRRVGGCRSLPPPPTPKLLCWGGALSSLPSPALAMPRAASGTASWGGKGLRIGGNNKQLTFPERLAECHAVLNPADEAGVTPSRSPDEPVGAQGGAAASQPRAASGRARAQPNPHSWPFPTPPLSPVPASSPSLQVGRLTAAGSGPSASGPVFLSHQGPRCGSEACFRLRPLGVDTSWL